MKFFRSLNEYFSKLSFKTKVTMSLIVFSLFLTTWLGVGSYRLSSTIIYDMSRDLSRSSFDYEYKSMDDYFSNNEQYATMFIRIPVLREILQADQADTILPRYNELTRSVRDIINLASSTDKITYNTLSIYCENGFSFDYFGDTGLPYNDYESCISHYTDNNYLTGGYQPPAWSDIIFTQDIYGRPDTSVINFRVLYHPVSMIEVGVILLGVRESDLSDIYSDLSGEAFIMHKNGLIISHPDRRYLNTPLNAEAYEIITGSGKIQDSIDIPLNNGDRQLVTYKKLARNELYYIAPFRYYTGHEVLDAQTFRNNIIAVFLIGILISVIMAMLLSKGLSSSMLSLKKTVQAVHDGDINARYSSKNNDEFTYLGERFNDMLDQITGFFREQRNYESAKSALEIKLMQSQINPHLLYNTLDSVLWALDKQDIAHGREIIYSLSSFFRLSLSGGNDLITLKDELELIRNYISIQRAARSKNFGLIIDIEEKLLNLRILKLSVQPIVENAIIHGFTGFRDDDSGVITITANITPDEKDAVIIIEDNGIGIEAQKLSMINEMLKTFPPKDEMRSFGLYNIERRLSTQNGKDYGLRFESELGNFTRVYINTPAVFIYTKAG